MFAQSILRRLSPVRRLSLCSLLAGAAILPVAARAQRCSGSSNNGELGLDWSYRGGQNWAILIANDYQFRFRRLTELSFSTYDFPFEDVIFPGIEDASMVYEEVETETGLRFDYSLTPGDDFPTMSSGRIFISTPTASAAPMPLPAYGVRYASLRYQLEDPGTGETISGTLDFVTIQAFDCDASQPEGCNTFGEDCDGNGLFDACEFVDGVADDCNNNGLIDACECRGDVNGNGSVGTGDLTPILQNLVERGRGM